MSLERGPLSLVSITEELCEFKSSGSGSRKPRLTERGKEFIRGVERTATPFETQYFHLAFIEWEAPRAGVVMVTESSDMCA
jgi:hypothetical protein